MTMEVHELKNTEGPSDHCAGKLISANNEQTIRTKDHQLFADNNEVNSLNNNDNRMKANQGTNAVLKRQNAYSKFSHIQDVNSPKNNEDAMVNPSPLVFLATFGALLGALSAGLALGYTAAAFVDMEKSVIDIENTILDSDPDQKESQKSLVGSTLAIGALVAALASEPCNNLLGRRIPLILIGIPLAIGWLSQAFARTTAHLVAGRLVVGACCGIICGTAPTYVIDIAPPQIRGALGTCFQLMIVIGNLLAALMGMLMSWRMLAGLSAIPGLVMTMMMLFLPESPSWLLGKQRRDEAQRALQKLRTSTVDNELKLMIQADAEQLQNCSSKSIYSYDILGSREFLRPLGYGFGLMFFQQFTGITAVLMYQSDIFKKASPDSDPLLATVWVNLAQVFAILLCGLHIDKLGRRPWLWISGTGSMLTLLVLGTYSHMVENDKSVQQNFAFVPLISLILFIVSYAFGLGPIPWMMIPELASPRIRSLVGSIGAFFAWGFAYITTASMKPLMLMVGDDWTYWLLSVVGAVSLIFIVILPETKPTLASTSGKPQSYV